MTITKTEQFNKSNLRNDLPDIRPGDTVRVYQKIKEVSKNPAKSGTAGQEDKDRIQVFEGLVIARKHGKGVSSTITVRRVLSGVGVEKVFPLHSPSFEKIEVVKKSKVRRAKLYYLRKGKGKKLKLKRKEFAVAIAEPDQNPPDIETSKEPTEEPAPAETPVENISQN